MNFRLHLPCALFGHRAKREPVWNDGFYFASCSRCAHDIIRIPGEKWHRPHHARVVWSTTALPTARGARLTRKHGPLQALSELPSNTRISGTVTRDIRQGAQAEGAVLAQRRSSIPDFMEDPQPAVEVMAHGASEAPGPRPVPARPMRVA